MKAKLQLNFFRLSFFALHMCSIPYLGNHMWSMYRRYKEMFRITCVFPHPYTVDKRGHKLEGMAAGLSMCACINLFNLLLTFRIVILYSNKIFRALFERCIFIIWVVVLKCNKFWDLLSKVQNKDFIIRS